MGVGIGRDYLDSQLGLCCSSGIDDGRILRRDRGCPDDESKRRNNTRNNESHDYKKGFLVS